MLSRPAALRLPWPRRLASLAPSRTPPLHPPPPSLARPASTPFRACHTAPPPPPLASLRKFGIHRLRPWLAASLQAVGYRQPTAIQAAAMPLVAKRADVIIHSATGTGKTLAFLLPILSRLEPGKPMQLLLLAPSRELALQLLASVSRLLTPECPLRAGLVIGGLSTASSAEERREEQRELARRTVASDKAEIVIATPRALSEVLRVNEIESVEERPRTEATAEEGRRGEGEGEGGEGEGGKAEARARRKAKRRASTPTVDTSKQMLAQMATNLEAIVLDEVDALLPKPSLEKQYFRRRDWAAISRQERRQELKNAGPAAFILKRLWKIIREARGLQEGDLQGAGFWRRGKKAAEARREEQRPAVQIIAASATVSKALAYHVQRLLVLPNPLEIVAVHTGHGKGRGKGAVGVPACIEHYVMKPYVNEADKPAMAAMVIQQWKPRNVLIVTTSAIPLYSTLTKLHDAGLTQAQALHHALGFPVRVKSEEPHATTSVSVEELLASPLLASTPCPRLPPSYAAEGAADDVQEREEAAEAAAAEAAAEVDRLQAEVDELRARSGGEEAEEAKHAIAAAVNRLVVARQRLQAERKAQDETWWAELKVEESHQPRVLVTTFESARGLDLPELDCVIMLTCPFTSDDYAHVSGRVGRMGRSGKSIILGTQSEQRRVGLFAAQLEVSIRPLFIPHEMLQQMAPPAEEELDPPIERKGKTEHWPMPPRGAYRSAYVRIETPREPRPFPSAPPAPAEAEDLIQSNAPAAESFRDLDEALEFELGKRKQSPPKYRPLGFSVPWMLEQKERRQRKRPPRNARPFRNDREKQERRERRGILGARESSWRQ